MGEVTKLNRLESARKKEEKLGTQWPAHGFSWCLHNPASSLTWPMTPSSHFTHSQSWPGVSVSQGAWLAVLPALGSQPETQPSRGHSCWPHPGRKPCQKHCPTAEHSLCLTRQEAKQMILMKWKTYPVAQWKQRAQTVTPPNCGAQLPAPPNSGVHRPASVNQGT